MRVYYRVTLRSTGKSLDTGISYRLRDVLVPLPFVWYLVRKGNVSRVTVHVSDTPVHRAWAWTRATARALWARRDPRHSVAVYSVDRYCADQIEGGRWFDTYALEDVRYCWRASSVQPLMDALEAQYPRTNRRYSVNGGEDYSIFAGSRFTPVPSYIDTYQPYE